MTITIKKDFKIVSNKPSFFNAQLEYSTFHCARLEVVMDQTSDIIDHLSFEEKKLLTDIWIEDKIVFESLPSHELHKFLKYLKENYPNLLKISGYNESAFLQMINIKEACENIIAIQEKHPLIPQILERINSNPSIITENKINTLNLFHRFILTASNEDITSLANKISKMDERPHCITDLIKGCLLTTASMLLSYLIFTSTIDIPNDASGAGATVALLLLVAGIFVGGKYINNFVNLDEEDAYLPEKDKVMAIGKMCS